MQRMWARVSRALASRGSAAQHAGARGERAEEREVRASSELSVVRSRPVACVVASKEWTSPDDTFHKKTPRADN